VGFFSPEVVFVVANKKSNPHQKKGKASTSKKTTGHAHAAKHAARSERQGAHAGSHAKDHATSPAADHAESPVPVDRRNDRERRLGDDRRKQKVPVVVERRTLERRVKVNRRRQIDPTTCERDYTSEEVEFMSALDEYKRRNGRMFPTCSEILEVVRSLGYVKCLPIEAEPLPVVEAPVVQSNVAAATSLISSVAGDIWQEGVAL
jgi:hypothetical protein